MSSDFNSAAQELERTVAAMRNELNLNNFFDQVKTEVIGFFNNQLPYELRENVVMLTCPSSAQGGVCRVYMIGVAHLSRESCQHVDAVIKFLKPRVIFLELCAKRMAMLSSHELQVPTMGEMLELWKKNRNMFEILSTWYLAMVANKLEGISGGEFHLAYESLMEYGSNVLLGDRPMEITIQRTWMKMPLWHKAKLLFSLVFQARSFGRLKEEMNETDNIDMLTLLIQEMSTQFPTLKETLIDERDQYMSRKLLDIARKQSCVVAVVSAGHMQGIKNNWQQPVAIDDLLSTKQPTSFKTMLSFIGVAVTGGAIALGCLLLRKK